MSRAKLAAVPKELPTLRATVPVLALPVLMSIPEAAAVIRGSKTFVRELLARGELRAVRIGRRVLVEPASLAELIERGRAVRP